MQHKFGTREQKWRKIFQQYKIFSIFFFSRDFFLSHIFSLSFLPVLFIQWQLFLHIFSAVSLFSYVHKIPQVFPFLSTFQSLTPPGGIGKQSTHIALEDQVLTPLGRRHTGLDRLSDLSESKKWPGSSETAEFHI